MTPHTLAGLVIGFILLALAGCGPSTKEDIIANGEVVYVIVGEAVTLEAAASDTPKK